MAIYSLNISNVKRSKGSNTCATLSYISGSKIRYEREAKTYSYGRSDRVVLTKTILPKSAPIEFENAETLFNSIENYDKSSNARTGKKIIVALPKELDSKTHETILDNFIKENITKLNYPCTYAVHTDKQGNNPHAHILIANRPINAKGEWELKNKKEYALDENGERIPILDENGNQKLGKRNEKLWKRISVKVNPLDQKETLEKIRKGWEIECNKYLSYENQIDHRSFEKQGKEEKPTIHEGYYARKIEENGEISHRCEINREIKKENELLKKISNKIKELTEKVKEKGERLNERVSDLLQRNRNARIGRSIRDNNRGTGKKRRDDIGTFISNINARISNAENSRKEREAEQLRLDIERQRELEKRNRKREILKRRSREKADEWDLEI